MNAAIRKANFHCASIGKEFVPIAGRNYYFNGRLTYQCITKENKE
jgi:hypothetical protein